MSFYGGYNPQAVVNALQSLIEALIEKVPVTAPADVADVLNGLNKAMALHDHLTRKDHDDKTTIVPISMLKKAGWTQKQTFDSLRGWAWFPPENK